MSETSPPSTAPIHDRFRTRDAVGFAADMELFTPCGPVRVDQLSVGDTVYALNPATRLAKPKPIVACDRVNPDTPLVTISTRSADLCVGPDQPIYYRTEAIARPRVVAARNLTDRVYYKFPGTWRTPPGDPLTTVDVTDLTDSYEARLWSDAHGNTVRAALPEGCEPVRHNGHSGYYFAPATFKRYQDAIETVADTVAICGGSNSRGRPYRFDGTDFLRFLGWFITEGSVVWTSPRDTAEIRFAQKTPRYRAVLRSLFDRMGLLVAVSDSGLSFGSTVYAELLERLCGARSATRHLPWFVWDLSLSQKRVLLDTLLAGDGNEHGTYYTASEQLACDALRLATDLGFTPRYGQRDGIWRIYLSHSPDGFRSDRNVERVSTTTPLVRLAVQDYPAVLTGRDGTFQWIGVSRVA